MTLIRYSIILIFSFGINTVFAQDKKEKKSHFYNITQFGYGIGIGKVNYKQIDNKVSYEGHSFRLRTEFGYYDPNHFNIGIGFGLDGYHESTMNTAPLFASFRYYLSQSRNPFFVLTNIGYSIKLNETFERGGLGSLEFGKKITLGRMSIMPSVGFNFFNAKEMGYFTYDPTNGQVQFYNDDLLVKTFVINVGFMF